MPTLVEYRQEKGSLWDKAKAINDKAAAEKRKLTAEEQTEWDRVNGEIERIDAQIKRDELAERRTKELTDTPDPALKPTPGDPSQETREQRLARMSPEARAMVELAAPEFRAELERRAMPAYRAMVAHYLRGGMGVLSVEQRTTLQSDIDTLGGFLKPPLEFVAGLLKDVDNLVVIRQFATKRTVINADGLGVVSLDTDVDDADWTTELKTGNEGALGFGRREMRPHPFAKRMKVSKKLLRQVPDVESIVRERLAYKFAVTEEKAFMTGTGVQQPLGLFTASADGIPTSRDVSTGNSQTAIAADGLIEAKHFIKAQYWPRLRWLFPRLAIKEIRKLKDGNGQYLWAPGLTGGIPDRILEHPYTVSEYAPATFTAGLYVGLIGDLSHYWIVDALDFQLQALFELYAETNQTGFIGRQETDGQPVLAEAFARVKLAP